MIDKLNISSITPCFIGGADNSNLELDLLRPPSLKGVMRWWFRALSRFYLELDELHKVESIIFGSTKNISPVNLQIICKKKRIKNNLRELSKKPYKFSYIWHPLYMNNFHTNYIDINSKFQIKLLLNKYIDEELQSNSDLIKRIWLHCLWLTLYLGGIGLKSRRGAGSFTTDEVDINLKEKKKAPEFKSDLNDDELGLYYKKQLDKIFRDFKRIFKILKFDIKIFNEEDQEKVLNKLESFSLIKGFSKLTIIDSYTTWREALKDLEWNWKKFRGNIKERGRDLLGFLGRPIITMDHHPFQIDGRLASPFYFSIKKKTDKKYFITCLNSSASHKEFEVEYRNGDNELVKIKENKLASIIEDWMYFLREKNRNGDRKYFTNKDRIFISF